MSEFNQPAYPVVDTDNISNAWGLTIRQQAVLMAMQGLLAGGASPEDSGRLGVAAVRVAAAVLKAEKESRDE